MSDEYKAEEGGRVEKSYRFNAKKTSLETR
jgi:hypothetical protein